VLYIEIIGTLIQIYYD